LNHW